MLRSFSLFGEKPNREKERRGEEHRFPRLEENPNVFWPHVRWDEQQNVLLKLFVKTTRCGYVICDEKKVDKRLYQCVQYVT